MRFFLLCWGVLGCQTAPQTPADCADLPCLEGLLLAQHATDPAAASAMLNQVPDGAQRQVMAAVLVQHDPAQAHRYCDRLGPGPSRDWCESLGRRPHLWMALEPPSTPAGRPGGGPATRDVLPQALPPTLAPPLEDPAECLGAASDTVCKSNLALWAAGRGEQARAQALCAGIEDARWRSECFFGAAEGARGRGGAEGYAQAAELCLQAGAFGANCQAHVIRGSLGRMPPAHLPNGAVWQAVAALAQDIGEHWASRDPAFGAWAVSRTWSDALSMAYEQSPVVTGMPAPFVPEAQRAHLHAAAAMRLVVLQDPRPVSLPEWVALLQAALANTTTVPSGQATQSNPAFVADLWPHDIGTEAQRPAVIYLGISRRTVGEDGVQDLEICLLEAMARVDLAGFGPILAGAQQHPSEPVRWTATRLLEQRQDATGHRPQGVAER